MDEEKKPKQTRVRRNLSRESLIRDLQLEIKQGNSKLKAIELIGKLKGYFDDPAGELDNAKPIYIIINTRRPPPKGLTSSVSNTNNN